MSNNRIMNIRFKYTTNDQEHPNEFDAIFFCNIFMVVYCKPCNNFSTINIVRKNKLKHK